MQTTHSILMVRPAAFRMNEETAVNNYFQSEGGQTERVADLALAEFDNFVQVLKDAGVKVFVVQDTGEFDTPDSLFPNNVISFHHNKAILYPMFAENRREERKLNYLGKLDQAGFHFEKTEDYTAYEDRKQFLEGTGVLILDRDHKIAYCSISDRADEDLLHVFCKDQGYKPFMFYATQEVDGQFLPIYHTNVMMSVGKNFCLICLDTVRDARERNNLENLLIMSGKEIIAITEDQMNHFAGNILEVKNITGDPLICMSSQAYEALDDETIERLEKHGRIIHAPLYSIEKFGGGSARCMMAEIFI